ncbi:putative 1-acyl-sn-glycerol-3-phosphate acyltransferase acl-12 [Ditylenchus destructor]|uniref:1-acyl-sn-glycerol-3-phosphate acyltransferase acl-12 n=1 Tax=Ditylenchus destructor TaxID=166010 RepID=A0AAD4QYL3_9BILA|nr:putative 1-acyl-sn-glycerol-3-phosphate acyltransferase acl-12 [Ditylenchus destructor]
MNSASGSRLFLIQDAEKEYCKKFGLTPFRNCAHPRSSAAFAVLSECSELNPETKDAPVEYVIDCTLGYPKGVVAGLGEAMIGEWPNDTTTVAIHYKVHKVKREWTEDEAKLKEWLYEQYKAKDDLLEEYYKTGTFPGKRRRVEFSLVHSVMVQVFWCALFYFHYNFTLKLVLKPLAMWILRLFWNAIF